MQVGGLLDSKGYGIGTPMSKYYVVFRIFEDCVASVKIFCVTISVIGGFGNVYCMSRCL